ncbi:hypothetical protein [Thalassospira xiamenensis]|uniref:hypothetical protein n=1 Tax=Thalassospira xiamenensis TaxID=220697 RepID=UPI003AA7DA13
MTHNPTKSPKINPMEADVTNRDFGDALDLSASESCLIRFGVKDHKTIQTSLSGQKIASNRHSVPDVHVTSFEDGHEITMPKRMDSDEAARYAATNDLF